MIIIINFCNYFTFVWFFFKFIPYKLFLTCRIGWHITVCGLRTLRYLIVWCSQTTTLNWTAVHFVRWSELWVKTDEPPIVLYQFYLLNVLGLCSHTSKAQNYWRSNLFHNWLRVLKLVKVRVLAFIFRIRVLHRTDITLYAWRLSSVWLNYHVMCRLL